MDGGRAVGDPGDWGAGLNACTIIARNYLAYARVLARSFKEHHPDGHFTVLVIDGPLPGPEEFFDVLTLDDILEPAEALRMAAIYDVTELATAVKPWLLRHLLDQGARAVHYFDPDMCIFTPLDDLETLAVDHQIVLTPHTTEPMPRDGRKASEEDILLSGVYNLGFIGVAVGAERFLDWWSTRLRRDCVVDHARALFVDQRWIDFVPAYFPHHILRDPGCNVAYWNLDARTVDRATLRFFHFSGYSPRQPWLLSRYQGDMPRILLSERPDLRALCDDYGRRLLECGFEEAAERPYGFGMLPNGIPFDWPMRIVYRRALAEAEAAPADLVEPPNPLDPEEVAAFIDWLNQPAAGSKVSRYLESVHRERPRLRDRFPDITGDHAPVYLEWIYDHAHVEAIPAELQPRPAEFAPPTRTAPLLAGINVAGYLRAESGVGEAARLLTRALEAAHLPYATVVYDRTDNRQAHPLAEGLTDPIFDISVICVNADQTANFANDMGESFFEGRYTVGMWAWEADEFPESMHGGFAHVDEVWLGSDFAAAAVAAATTKPVFTFPLPVEVPTPTPRRRAELGLPDGFLFLYLFDFASVFERKNPVAAVEAFAKAFPDPESEPAAPRLVIKTVNGHRHLPQLERLRHAAAPHAGITVIDGYVSAGDKDALLASADAYVSLHRSEGFGLTLAESMALGKPVIATGYSGNLEYMDDRNSYLVRYTLTAIPADAAPYPAGGKWAEPDLDDAARLLRRVVEFPAEALDKGRRAADDIARRHSPAARAVFLIERFDQIRRQRAAVATAALEHPPPGRDRASHHLATGPYPTDPSRYGVIGEFGRRILFRLLRPYWWGQHDLDHALLDAVRDGEAVRRAEHEAALRTTTAMIRRAETRLREAVLAELETRPATAAGLAPAGGPRRFHELASRIDELERELTRVTEELSAVPYTAEPSHLLTVDPFGRPAIGYRDAAGARRQDDYKSFEDIFRGPEPFIRDRQRIYLKLLDREKIVLDVGCGRGEFLDLLKEAGIPGVGVDIDPGMVQQCREKGHRVEQTDAVTYLRQAEPGSVGAIFSAQVVEHLSYEEFTELIDLSFEKLAPGGLFIAETVNPHSVPAWKTFWVDLTHRMPIFPEVAVALCRIHGFPSAYVLFPNGTGELESDRGSQGEYAVVACK